MTHVAETSPGQISKFTWVKRGSYGSDPHHLDESGEMRALVHSNQNRVLLARQAASRSSDVAWLQWSEPRTAVASEHLEVLFDSLANTIRAGLAQSVLSSMVLFLSHRVRDLDRRFTAFELNVAEAAQGNTIVWVDWKNVVDAARQTSEELGWVGAWHANVRERRLEFRVTRQNLDRVGSGSFELYRKLAQRLDGDVMKHLTIDYEIVDS